MFVKILTQNISSDKLLIQTNVLGSLEMMFYNKYKNVSTYIIIFLVSSAAFAILFVSANVSAHSEQVYEMTDHQIKNNTINKAYEHKDPTNNGEQRDGKVFALIN